MSNLILDVETTGLPDWHTPSDAPHQPHLVELAMLLVDGEGNPLDAYESLVKPEGWEIPDEAIATHGITTEQAMDEGAPELDVVQAFMDTATRGVNLLIGHNVSFEKRILRIALKRYFPGNETVYDWLKAFPDYCTMRKSTDHCRLPPTDKMMASGRKTFKSPTLAEAYRHFTGEDFDGAHRAMADCEACRRVFLALRGGGKVEAAGEPAQASAE